MYDRLMRGTLVTICGTRHITLYKTFISAMFTHGYKFDITIPTKHSKKYQNINEIFEENTKVAWDIPSGLCV